MTFLPALFLGGGVAETGIDGVVGMVGGTPNAVD